MSATSSDRALTGALGDACGTLPPGFVRLRYFFGKRLGVADFVDEQRYHAGKMRFHNQHLHGAGVLCGLGAARLAPDSVVLRVGKGAALDGCGREIVVGYDQCIDVDAWYARVRDEKIVSTPTWPAPDLDANGRLPLCVVLRYRESAGQPEPAPRDPCSCDASGCDFGRVREEFELDLAIEATVAGQAPPALFPGRAALDRALGRAVGGAPLRAALAAAAQEAVPAPEGDDWLLVASVAAELDATREHVVALHDVRATATVLHQAAVVQELVLRSVAATLEAGALVDGPEITGLRLVRVGASYELVMPLSAPIIEATLKRFLVMRLHPVDGWGPPGVAGETTAYRAAAGGEPPCIVVSVADASGHLAAGGVYRLVLDDHGSATEPVVDASGRPLRPLRPSLHFTLTTGANGDLVLADPSYVL